MAPQLSEDEVDDLIYLARTGDNDELKSLLLTIVEREKILPAEVLIAAKDEGKSTCLHMAAANGHLDTVTLLLSHFASRPKEEKQAYLDAPNEYGNAGLHWASMSGHLPIVKVLVEEGASVALPNDKNYIPLDLASFNEKFDVVDYFLKKSGDLEQENGEDGLNGAVANVEIEDEDDSAGSSKPTEGSSSS
ncbi:hypothetical protein OQA88_4233 [Cercophora sp. LCS_1]